MVVTARPAARNAGIRQECTGVPSSHTVQAPQSPGVAALLDAEHAELAQEGAQALSGLRLGGKFLAVDMIDRAVLRGGGRMGDHDVVHWPAPENSPRICSQK